jgi:hypothetical protein
VSPEVAIATRLAADAAVAALVAARIYQLKLPQNPTLPAIRVQLISDALSYHLRGEEGIRRSRVQVDVYVADAGDAYAAAEQLAEAVHAALSGARFTLSDGGSPASTATVTGVFREARGTLYEAEELRLVRIQQDYSVWTR